MRYLKFVGDGDSSAFRAVTNLQPYDDANVVKEECINHISKRLGTRLRKLREETREETSSGRKRTTIGGKNKLTDKVIDKLTFYYGQAIRRNIGGSIDAVQKDILASYYHCTSTDSSPQHQHCPAGRDSWCFYRRAQATGRTASHSEMKVKFILPPKDKAKVARIYNELTDDDLLSRCLLGKTQNPNESLHSKIWYSIQKIKFFGLKTTTYNAHHTILVHNIGHQKADLSEELGFGPVCEIVETFHKSQDYTTTRRSIAKTSKRRQPRQAPGEGYAAGEY